MNRFAGLIITLGVGAAVLSGHGIAQAEPSESSDSSSGTSTDSPSRPSTSSGAQTTDTASTAPSTGDSPDRPTSSTAPSRTEPATPARKPGSRSRPDTDTDTEVRSARNSAITSPAAASESTPAPERDDTEPSAPTAQAPSATPSQPTAPIDDVSVAPPVSAAVPSGPQRNDSPEPAESIAAVVSNVLGGLLGPLSTGSVPATPPGAPVAWTVAAFARREFDTALTPASPAGDPASVPKTAPTLQAVENSLTYTPPPTIIDQLTVAALRVVRDVTGFFGISFSAIVGQLVASEDPPFLLTLGLNARQTEFEVSPGNVWKVWEFEPPDPTGATVVAIHGGGFVVQPNVLHWLDYTQMARDTGATVLVPLYPLATTESGSILNVTPGMADYLSKVIDERGAENVSVYADSGGATYAFAATRELILRGADVPASMVVISGQADYSTENDGGGIDDPFFNPVTVEYFTRFHAFDGVVDKDPRISPLRMETEVLQALPPTTMYIGTEEILLPANLLLYQRAVNIGAPISMVVGQGQFHNWPVSGLPVNSAAPLVRRDIYRQLGLLPDAG